MKTAVLGTELVKIKNKLSGEWKLREERERNVGQAFPFWAALCRRASAFLIELSHADINDHRRNLLGFLSLLILTNDRDPPTSIHVTDQRSPE